MKRSSARLQDATPAFREELGIRIRAETPLCVREDGSVIADFARNLPMGQRLAVLDEGREIISARRKRDLPKAIKNITTSAIVGQGMWYLACPLISSIPGIRQPIGWFAWGGSDKLFISPDNILYHTAGYSTEFAAHVASLLPGTLAVGVALVMAELAADLSKCWVEYYTQKKYGIVGDAVARAYGQNRPFWLRYSTLEAYQKAIGYALKPASIGTPKQIFSSVQGISGSLWRISSGFAIVATAGRWIDRKLEPIERFTEKALEKAASLFRSGKRTESRKDEAARREREAFERIRQAVGDEQYGMLRKALEEEAKTFWKWNPLKRAKAKLIQ